ncbi:DUF2958 domain-containing protein [Sphingomonas bisphenolicum]
MILLPDDLREALRANAIRHGIAMRGGLAEPDFLPLLKLFNPVGAATWLATELAEDWDTLFGLADLGFGCPELGTFSLSEIGAVRLPYGMGIERDLAFETVHPLSVWASWSRRSGSILWAQTMLRRHGPASPDGPADLDIPPS